MNSEAQIIFMSKAEHDQAMNELDKDQHQSEAEPKNNNFLTVKPINDWINEAKNLKIPAKLFGEFWYESEMVILFASAGVGKTLLAYQIATGLTEGKRILNFEPELTPQKVLYCDFELSSKQVEKRYSDNFRDHYNFSDYLIRAEINHDANIPDNMKFEQFVINELENLIINTGAKILMVDNITYFGDNHEKAKDAIKLMKGLQQLKKRHGLSVLVLAHTPKRDTSKPITRNDISGSSMIINFTDSAFGIGESTNEKNTRYLIQVKPGRFSSTAYNANNVMVCRINNPLNFTQYEFIEFGRESEHLRTIHDKTDRDAEIMKLRNEGKSYRDIADKVNLSHTAVSDIVKGSQ